MAASDTGWSVAQTQAYGADRAWPDILAALQAGAVLHRPSGMRDYYTQGLAPGDRGNGRCLYAARVKKLEREGVLMRIGVDTYGLIGDGT
jgi:hypothetical protein